MFHDITERRVRVGSRKAYVVPVSIGVHVLVAALVFILPIMAPGLVPDVAQRVRAFETWDIFLPPPPPPPAPVKPEPVSRPPEPAVKRDAAPVNAPDRIAPEPPIPERRPASDERGGGAVTGCFENCGTDLLPAPPPPPPPPDKAPEVVRRVGGDIRPPAKVKDVTPEYPAIALATRTQGVVILEATLDVNGHVADARILRSIPLLDAAAVAAVRQWEYTPTLLNGVPVPIVMTVTVNFALK